MKKIISLFLILTLCFSMFTINASAFGGYAHWYMADSIANRAAATATQKLAYKSGCLLADIGYLLWDGQCGYKSDEYNFALSMYLAVSIYPDDFDENAVYMYYGWRDHYHQDIHGSAAIINSPHGNNYRQNCGWIDEYLRDELGNLDYPIQHNQFSELYIDYDLISRSYELLGASAKSRTAIRTQILAMFQLFDGQILANSEGWTETDELNIIDELDRCHNYCDGFTLTAPDYIRTASTTNVIETAKEKIIKDIVIENTDELSKYLEIEETPISETASYLKISILDNEKYSETFSKLYLEKTQELLNK